MQYRSFGSTAFSVSVLGFGGGAISGEGKGYGFGPISEAESIALARAAYERGINLFDTAPAYGFGTSEQRIGLAVKPFRDKVCVVTKGGVMWDEKQRMRVDNSPKTMHDMLHASLKRLDMDYVDLYFIHWPDEQVDIRKPMEVLAKAVEAGKIRYIGLSNPTLEDIVKAREIAPISVLQAQYNAFVQQAASLFPVCTEHGCGFMGWGTLDKGILSGSVTKERRFDSSDLRSSSMWKFKERLPRIAAMEAFIPLLHRKGIAPQSFALAFALAPREVSTVLCGPRNIAQWEELIDTLESLPPVQIVEELAAELMELHHYEKKKAGEA